MYNHAKVEEDGDIVRLRHVFGRSCADGNAVVVVVIVILCVRERGCCKDRMGFWTGVNRRGAKA
jgi:hypothetical protein